MAMIQHQAEQAKQRSLKHQLVAAVARGDDLDADTLRRRLKTRQTGQQPSQRCNR